MADCGFHTSAGTHSAVNQDAGLAGSCTLGGKGGTISYAAVFDGHSAFGEVAATKAREALAAHITSDVPWDEQPDLCMHNLMKALNAAVIEAHRPASLPSKHTHASGGARYLYKLNAAGTAFSVSREGAKGDTRNVPVDFGCTAAVAVLTPAHKLVVGNLGDSAVLLCSARGGDDLEVSRLSQTHTAATASEVTRIQESCGDSVKCDGEYIQSLKGPLAGHCLQPTRGLGHPVWAICGVSSEPHVRSMRVDEVDYDPERKGFAVVVLSDGVTDLIADASILDTVAKSVSAAAAARELVEEAAAMADASSRGRDRDDATAAILCW